jgi:hypothetical protein
MIYLKKTEVANKVRIRPPRLSIRSIIGGGDDTGIESDSNSAVDADDRGLDEND